MAKLSQVNTRLVLVVIEIGGEQVTLNVKRNPVTLDQWREFDKQTKDYQASKTTEDGRAIEVDLKTSPLIHQLCALVACLDLQDEGGAEIQVTPENLLKLDSRLLALIHGAVMGDASPDFNKPAST